MRILTNVVNYSKHKILLYGYIICCAPRLTQADYTWRYNLRHIYEIKKQTESIERYVLIFYHRILFCLLSVSEECPRHNSSLKIQSFRLQPD